MVNEAVIALGIADLGEVGLGSQAFALAVFEEGGAVAPHEIDVAFYIGITDVGLAVDLQGVLETI